jgi:hypothetical protein
MKTMLRVLLVLGMVALVAVAFLAGRWLPGGATGAAPSLPALGEKPPAPDGGEVIVIDNGAGPVRITFSDPSELPDEPAITGGLFKRLQDNSLFLGTGSIEVSVESVNGEVSVAAHNDGPEVEVVVTSDTVIYEDITERPIIGPEEAEKGEMVVLRQVRLVDGLDSIGENMMVRVWGEKRGERVIARVIYYDRVGLD